MNSWRLELAAALLVTAACIGAASAFFHDYFPAGADGSFNTYPDEGYAVADDGNWRHAKLDHHFGFMQFVTEKSDGRDRIREGFAGDAADGVLLTSWIVGKKVASAYLYVRDASNEFCNASLPAGTYLNDPVAVLGFRAGNGGGVLNDRGYLLDTDPASSTYEQWILVGSGGGCCADVATPLVREGENSPVAWRMGQPPYAAKGDIGTDSLAPGTPEYWKVSDKDSVVANRRKFLQAGTLPFDPDGDGTGGWSGDIGGTETNLDDGMFAFEWLIRNSDAHLPGSWMPGSHVGGDDILDGADCTPGFGGTDPRDIAGDGTGGLGWYAVRVSRCFVFAMATEAGLVTGGFKGVVLNAINSTFDPAQNTQFYGRDQGGDHNAAYCPYLDIRATYNGDCRLVYGILDGKVNVFDLSTMAAAWNSTTIMPQYNPECDFNCDGKVNVFDLNMMAANWNKTTPDEP
mgnify:CR=1 FL=1